MRYEDLVAAELELLYPGLVERSVPASGGYIDFLLRFRTPVLVEAKSTYCSDAWFQLQQYARAFDKPVARVTVCGVNDLSVKTAEQPRYVRGLAKLEQLEPGYYVIPWTGRFAKAARSRSPRRKTT